jgi:eukaryotic-like serine/threonine-protein kinase
MGKVWRAHHIALKRDDALKVLPEAFASDPERLARFQREAQVLASLNHPNIARVYGLEESDGTKALVMELVEGPTVADRIAKGPISIDEALPIAKQIAEALEAAHEQGIIHRDLKPANIKVRPDGTVKVLDFGLAKALDPTSTTTDPSQAPTITSPAVTRAGVILGTAAYMSPEQARGKVVDTAADMWAFGCVLFEMFCGEQAFKGEDVTETLASVVKGEPNWKILPAETPSNIRSLLRQCLQKQRSHRLDDARAARISLEDAIAVPESASLVAPRQRLPRLRMLLPYLAVSFLVGALGDWFMRPLPPTDRPLTRVLLDLRPAEQFVGSNASTRPSRTAMALTPDGQTIVFSGRRGTVTQLFLRRLGEAEATPMAGTEGASFPVLSPDGRWVGFLVNTKLMKVPIGGGPPVAICDVSSGVLFGTSWGSGDRIVYANAQGVWMVSAAGGSPTLITKTDPDKSEAGQILPHVLPGGKAMLYTVVASDTDWEHTSVVVQSLETSERRTLIQGGADARYVSSGHLLYMKTGTLTAVPFDAERLVLRGTPVAMLDNVMQATGAYNLDDETRAGQFAVSTSGTLAYLAGGVFSAQQNELAWVDRKGASTVLPISSGGYFAPRVSPDGKRVAYTAARGRSNGLDIWVYDIERQNSTRLTFQGTNVWPVWAPDGKSLVFSTLISRIPNLARIRADGSGAPERLMTSQHSQTPAAWSPSGDELAFLEDHEGVNQIWVLSMGGNARAKPFLQTPYSLTYPAFSPDGRWIAYVSPESGSPEVYVQPYPGPGEKIRISTSGGLAPIWARGQRELFYVRPSGYPTIEMMMVESDTTHGFRSSRPRLLFDGQYGFTFPMGSYDIVPDGQRFIVIKIGTPEPPVTQLHLILNWTDELKRLAPAK